MRESAWKFHSSEALRKRNDSFCGNGYTDMMYRNFENNAIRVSLLLSRFILNSNTVVSRASSDQITSLDSRNNYFPR